MDEETVFGLSSRFYDLICIFMHVSSFEVRPLRLSPTLCLPAPWVLIEEFNDRFHPVDGSLPGGWAFTLLASIVLF
jgi:hypothetical protein